MRSRLTRSASFDTSSEFAPERAKSIALVHTVRSFLGFQPESIATLSIEAQERHERRERVYREG